MHHRLHLRPLHPQQQLCDSPLACAHVSSCPAKSHILQSPSVQLLQTKRPSNPATYQTNLNHLQYSKCNPPRLTLSMLWFLRVPPMVRTAFIAFSLAVLLATSAGAARINPSRTPAHATATKSTTHAAHAPSHSKSKSSRTAKPKPATSTSAHSSHSTTHRGKQAASSTSHRASSSTSRSAVRRSRYNLYHSKKRYVAL